MRWREEKQKKGRKKTFIPQAPPNWQEKLSFKRKKKSTGRVDFV